MDKTGGKYENAIEDAIIAMNEPKDASVTAIRDYVGRFLPVLRIRDVYPGSELFLSWIPDPSQRI